MSRTVLVIGAKGRFGRAAITAFQAAGWHVRGFARNWPTSDVPAGVDHVSGDAFDAGVLSDAAMGADLIVNALNPPYPRWKKDLPRLTANVIAAARASGAPVMIPGNVYNYGAAMPERLTEETPHLPQTKKGALREEMEESYAHAADDGVRTLILRAGDFIEQAKTGNWFDTYIAHNISKRQITYPGALSHVHAWAYLPDMARAMAALAEKQSQFAMFERFNFEGYSLTGQQLIDAVEVVTGQSLKRRKMPWGVMRAIAPLVPTVREVLELRYLWDVPHALDGSKLRAALPDFAPTPLHIALADALGVANSAGQGVSPPETRRAAQLA